jgi:methionyl aminopeptidase
MSIDTPEQLEGMRRVGRVVALALRAMRNAVRPGVTTASLDGVAARVLERHGARSAPQLDYDFPAVTCISVDDEAVHGIPGPRRLRPGNIVKLDVTVELAGYYADACVTVPVGPPARDAVRLMTAASEGLAAGMRAAVAGAPLHAVGSAVQHEVESRGASVCQELCGHGIGRRIHEPPTVPSVYSPAATRKLTEGLVMTIEPIVAAGSGDVVLDRVDGWTVRTLDGSPTAHAEHTIVVQQGAPLVLTAY